MAGETFPDRREAGKFLAGKLSHYAGSQNILVLALPRGGVPVAFEVARALQAPLDVFVVRKLGVPGHEEFAMGALAAGGIRVLNHDLIAKLGIPNEAVNFEVRMQAEELARRETSYRQGRPALDAYGHRVIVVDDGLATGSTMEAAVMALRRQNPISITIAVPVGAAESCGKLEKEADEIVCGITPDPFRAVGYWYQDFREATDDEVRELLSMAGQEAASRS